MSIVLSDPPSERAVLAGLCQYGGKIYYDVIDMLQPSTFNVESNKLIFRCIQHIMQADDNAQIDVPLIHAAAHELGFSYVLVRSDEVKHLQAILHFPIHISNVAKFAAKIRKLEVAKLMHVQLEEAQQKLLEVKGDETLTQILSIAENTIFDFTSLLSDIDEGPERLGEGAKEKLEELASNPVTQIGIPTGFPVYDMAIGGGLRDGTINVLGARMKAGKSILGDNIGRYISENIKLPVLNMDTEMLKEDHQYRTLAAMSHIPINDIETGQFSKNPSLYSKVLDASTRLKNMPYFHKHIGGKSLEEQLALMRRWIVKEVGLNTDGTAKKCVIIYDYLKLTDDKDITKNLAEYQVLGFMMTTLHNFATRYKIPILAFVQLNRDGITKETTDTASGSDRILWLCDNFSIFKAKSDEEIAMDGTMYNRKLVPVVARHGEGLDTKDYINYKMEGKYGLIKEGKTAFELREVKHKEEDGFVVENDGDIDIEFQNN